MSLWANLGNLHAYLRANLDDAERDRRPGAGNNGNSGLMGLLESRLEARLVCSTVNLQVRKTS